MVSSKLLQEVSYSTVLSVVVAFLFAFYGPKLVTEMPDSVRVVFENNIARFTVMVLIVYLGNHNLQLSLVITVCIILIMSYVHKYEIKEELTNKIHRDFYTNSPIVEPYSSEGELGTFKQYATDLMNGEDVIDHTKDEEDVIDHTKDEEDNTKVPYVPSEQEEDHQPNNAEYDLTLDHESFTNYRRGQLQNIENSVQSMVNSYKMIG